MLKIWENCITELYDWPNRPENLDVKPEKEVDTDEKGPYILKSDVEKAIKEIRNKKSTGIGGCYGMKMNVEKTKVMRISRQQFPVKIVIDQKQLENLESFNFWVAF